MKLIVTGGGTGGHVYPALEVAKYARSLGDDITYFGSFRGQEGKASQAAGFAFLGFPSEPLYSIRTWRGIRAAMRLLKARGAAKRALEQVKPDAVFSTGGYAAGPVVAAAEVLGIRYVIHEGNSVPGRSNLMFAKSAVAFTTLFKSTERYSQSVPCKRVGQPIRTELRDAVRRRKPEPDFVLCIGGSQGSEYLNGSLPRSFAGERLATARCLLSSGPKNFESTLALVLALGVQERVEVRPYLNTDEIVEAYCRASVVVGRSGSTLAEIAMFGIPSVLVPLPTAAGEHQLHNAEEFESMNAATLLPQPDATPLAMSEAISDWLLDTAKYQQAVRALKEWDLPGATQSIYGYLKGASQ